MRHKLWGALAGLVLVGVLGLAPHPGVGASESREAVMAQFVVDGEVLGSFEKVSEIKMEIEVIEYICRADGRDDDCDDTDSEVWQADVLETLWELDAAAGTLDQQAWFSSRAKHEIAKNAIGNIRRLAHELTHVVQQGGSASARHDTSKNAIGNIRAVYRVISSIAIDEPGVQVAMRQLGESINGLSDLVTQSAVRYRPGRPVYGNITFEGKVEERKALLQWINDTVQGKSLRKSGSIIYLDRTGAEVMRINLFECWPVSHSVGMAVEKIEIAVERVERAK